MDLLIINIKTPTLENISFKCKHCFKEWENLRQHNIIVVKFDTIMSQKKISRIKLNQTTRNVRNFKNEVYRDGATDA